VKTGSKVTTDAAAAMDADHTLTSAIDEDARRRFEAARRQGSVEPLSHFLPSTGQPHYLATLEELVQIDLEFAWKRWQSTESRRPEERPFIEGYLRQFPQLNEPAILQRLVEQEHGLRQRYGDQPTWMDYRDRFPLLPTFEANEDTYWQAPERTQKESIRIPGYEVLGTIARGGMGVVLKARQLSLNRLVALKMILTGAHASEEEQDRFRIEAEAAARLQHANIVQVYEIGNCDGKPYLCMELIDGGNLAQCTAGQPQSPRAAARFVELLARAAHHAHQRGVIHRDLKPANILLVNSGALSGELSGRAPTDHHSPLTSHQPKITDFGLAKRMEMGSGHTKTGDLVGTPCYMAPEQATGKSEQIGPLADVYALGAILYELLTARPPFRGNTPWETVEQLLHQEPVKPRSLQPAVPRDLETICLKCLQKDPERRYATAEALADDLARFVRDDPITARPVSGRERLWRWCRRNRYAAALLVLLAIALLGGGGMTLVWLRGESQRADADAASLRDAQEEIEKTLARAGNEQLSFAPQLADIQRDMLEDAVVKLQRLLGKWRSDPALRRQARLAHLLAGNAHELLGRHAEAEKAYREAIALMPGGVSLAAETALLARAHYHLAGLLATTGELREAEEHYRRALELQQPDASELVASAEQARDLARTQTGLASILVLTGRFTPAEQLYRQTLQIRVQGTNEADPLLEFPQTQAEASLADLLLTMARTKQSDEHSLHAMNRLQLLVEQSPKLPVYRAALGRVLSRRAMILENQYDLAQAGPLYFRAHELFKKLAEDHPHLPDYRQESVNMLFNLARFRNDGGGSFLPDSGPNPPHLDSAYREVVAASEKLVAAYPAVVDYRRRLALSLNWLATWLQDTQRSAEAEEMHKRSHAIWVKLAADFPDVIEYQNGVCLSAQRYGIVLESTGRYDEAERLYREAVEIQTKLAARFPQVPRHRIFLSALHNNLGVIEDRRGYLPAAEQRFRQAVDHVTAALQMSPRAPVCHHLFESQTSNLASVLRREGRYQEASRLAETLPRTLPPPWRSYHRPAEILAAIAAAVEKDANLSDEQRRELVESCTQRIMDFVREGIERGVSSDQLKSERGFERVRKRDDFQKLLRELEAKEKEKEK
jgi:eukaryotic-like serine/threonine-protein kinase